MEKEQKIKVLEEENEEERKGSEIHSRIEKTPDVVFSAVESEETKNT